VARQLEEEGKTISIVIPVLNSERVLGECLRSILIQDCPRKRFEIIAVDGGSRDRTVEVAQAFGVDRVLRNPLRTGEAGKAVGVEAARNEIVAFIDSDNILDRRDWLKRMLEPFEDPSIVGADTLYYTYRREDPLITRYCALIGSNDPLCVYLGNFDRYCHFKGTWTEMSARTEDRAGYLKMLMGEMDVPGMGADGFLVRAEALKDVDYKPFYFDIDVVHQFVVAGKHLAKVKIGIVHLFANNIRVFIRKTYRRINDYLYFDKLGMRKYPWRHLNRVNLLKFILYNLLLIPLIWDLTKGYKKVPDKAWFFHPIACWIVLLTYGLTYVVNRLVR